MKNCRYLFLSLLVCTSITLRANSNVDAELTSYNSTTILPVTGTFLNFFWQDERNNYMNQRNVDQTDPQRWACKVAELHEMGVDYLIFMAVANEGKAIYPSAIMPHAYPEGRKSPIDAIMDTADSLGMHVIVSTGWARNQLDKLDDPYVIEMQRKIMEELAQIYGKRPSFYGWYLPVEGCFIPYLSEHAVSGVNKIAARARELTPGAKVLISPYGTFAAHLDDPRFAQSIYDLDVDIIAFQDEIGCVRETFPMQNMKRNFERIGQIQRNCDIEFWANVESFTWDRKPNNWYSTLVPAAFGRYLSQIVGISQAGASRIISFAITGIMDKPNSPYPVGQMQQSNTFYEHYKAWREGDSRWKLLEDIYAGRAFEQHVIIDGPTLLGDANFAWENPSDSAWACFDNGEMSVVLDLGKTQKVSQVAAHFCQYSPSSVSIPQALVVEVSKDGKNYDRVKVVAYENWPNDLLDCWTDVILADNLNVRARFIRVSAYAAEGKILCSEVVVK